MIESVTEPKKAGRLRLALESVLLDDLLKGLAMNRGWQKRFADARLKGQLHDDGQPAPEEEEMFNLGDITINYPQSKETTTTTTQTTDTAAVATAVGTAVEKVQAVHNSPLGKWGRRLLYTGLGASLLGNVIAVPTALYAALREQKPATATATVNVPPATGANKPTDADTDTRRRYRLRVLPN